MPTFPVEQGGISVDIAVVAPAVLGAGWVALAARRAPEGLVRSAACTVAGGAVALAAAWAGYAALERNGMEISWDDLTAGGGGSVLAAAAIGLLEESAKLLGLALASLGARAAGRAGILPRIVGVSAVFASAECAFTLGGADAAVVLLRAAFAPVAHAALALPLGLALAGGRRGLRWALPALGAAAVLHGAADLSLALPELGRLGYAAILAAPVVALHLRTRMLWARAA